MIDHYGINVTDLAATARFYDAVLGVLGFTRQMDFGEAIGYALADAAVIEGISMTISSTNQTAAAQAVINAAEALGYSTTTIAAMVGVYNHLGTAGGCNYGVDSTLGIFADGFASNGTGAVLRPDSV